MRIENGSSGTSTNQWLEQYQPGGADNYSASLSAQVFDMRVTAATSRQPQADSSSAQSQGSGLDHNIQQQPGAQEFQGSVVAPVEAPVVAGNQPIRIQLPDGNFLETVRRPDGTRVETTLSVTDTPLSRRTFDANGTLTLAENLPRASFDRRSDRSEYRDGRLVRFDQTRHDGTTVSTLFGADGQPTQTVETRPDGTQIRESMVNGELVSLRVRNAAGDVTLRQSWANGRLTSETSFNADRSGVRTTYLPNRQVQSRTRFAPDGSPVGAGG